MSKKYPNLLIRSQQVFTNESPLYLTFPFIVKWKQKTSKIDSLETLMTSVKERIKLKMP